MTQYIVVLGYGKSTQSAIQLLKMRYNAEICVLDEMYQGDIEQSVKRINTINEVPIQQVLFCLKSPGIDYQKEYVQYLLKHHIPIYTDVELFLRDTKAKVIAITGTNGKTTVTTLIGDVLKQKFTDVRICGNIGVPIADVCEGANENTIFVVELSSFQLKGTNRFKPDISVLLNLADAHLDYHQNRVDYECAKAKIFENQKHDDVLIYNADDANVVQLVKMAKARKISVGKESNADVKLTEENIEFLNQTLSYRVIKVPGGHNRFNVACAFTIGLLMKLNQEEIEAGIQLFQGVKHRLQYVKTVQKNDVYNDSKSTNEAAVKTALNAFETPLIWICGGYDRNIPYTDLGSADLSCVKHIVTFGQMAKTFKQLAIKHNIKYTIVSQFADVFKVAMDCAEDEDIILFSPGAASYDMFMNFEERGEAFLKQVENY